MMARICEFGSKLGSKNSRLRSADFQGVFQETEAALFWQKLSKY
jgi:hypothetical protein